MLPHDERLLRQRDFSAVYARKKSWATPLLVLYIRRFTIVSENAETRRFGFSVSKKVGKAHDRNRIKRRLREICRAQRSQLQHGFDAVFVVRTAASTADFAQLTDAVRNLFRRAGLQRKPSRETEKVSVSTSATLTGGNGSSPPEPGSV
jgi:ribonuclease P protein component